MYLDIKKRGVIPVMADIYIPGIGKHQVYYKITGRGDPFLCLPGLLNTCRVTDEFFSCYLERYGLCMRFDSPGWGKTPPLEVNDLEILSELVKALLDFWGIPKTYLIGNSMGATLGLLFMIRNPERVQAAVLHDPVIEGKDFSDHDQLILKENRDLAIRYPLLGKYLLGTRVLAYFGGDIPALLRAKKAYRLILFLRDIFTFSMRATVEILEDLMSLDFSEELGKIETPILLVSGDKSSSCQPVNSVLRLSKIIPNSEVRIFPGGHLAPHLQAERFVKEAVEFCRRHPISRRRKNAPAIEQITVGARL